MARLGCAVLAVELNAGLATVARRNLAAFAARADLYSCIAGLIDGEYGGRLTKRYLTHLAFAPRTT